MNSSHAVLILLALSIILIHAHSWADTEQGAFVGYVRAGAGITRQGGPENCYYLGNGVTDMVIG